MTVVGLDVTVVGAVVVVLGAPVGDELGAPVEVVGLLVTGMVDFKKICFLKTARDSPFKENWPDLAL